MGIIIKLLNHVDSELFIIYTHYDIVSTTAFIIKKYIYIEHNTSSPDNAIYKTVFQIKTNENTFVRLI